MATTEQTIVVFRKWNKPNRGIIALFPQDDVGNGFCQSYEHVGQHGGADYSAMIKASKPATPEEYESLRKELEGIGYNLVVRKRR